MRTEIRDLQNNLVSRIVNSSIIDPHVREVHKELLGGGYHIQAIGTAIKKIKIKCYVTPENKEVFDNFRVNGEPIKLLKGTKAYTGLITDKADWGEPIIGKYFEANFVLVVQGEGSR